MSSSKQYQAFTIIILCFLLTQLNFSTYLPTLPILVQKLHSHSQMIMLTLAILFAGYAIGQLVWGTLSDYIGRRRVVMIALLAYAVIIASVAFSHRYVTFCVGFTAASFMVAALTSVGNAIVRDIFTQSAAATRAIATIGVLMAAGPIIGPFVGAHLAAWWGWQAIFIFLSLFAWLLMLGVYFLIPETGQHSIKQSESLRLVYQTLLSSRYYVGYLLILGLMFGTMFSLLDTLPFIYHHLLQLNLLQSGQLMSLTAVGIVIGAVVVRQKVKKVGPNSLILTGLFCAFLGAGGLLVLIFHGYGRMSMIVLLLMLICFGFGLVVPSTKGGAMTVFQKNSGCAASMMKFVQSMLLTINIAIFSHWQDNQSLFPVLTLIIVLSAISLVLYLVLLTPILLGKEDNG